MVNPRSNFAVGDRVKEYDVERQRWTYGTVHRVNHSARSTTARPICGYLLNFDGECGGQGQFSNCNPFVMGENAHEGYFIAEIMPGIDMGSLYCQYD
jgi:hypothetical protein